LQIGKDLLRIITNGTADDLPVAEKAISQSDCIPIHPIVATVMLLYQTLQSVLIYYTVIQRTWVMVAGSNFAFTRNLS